MAKEVYWHLPGFCSNFYLYQILIDFMTRKYPDKFVEGYKVGSVYGTFPGAVWNGGRAAFGSLKEEYIKAILDTYEKLGAPVRFTWTNPLLKDIHTKDLLCNRIMELASGRNNQVLCNSEMLEAYLREKYPSFKFVSSTTKRIKDLDGLLGELQKDYIMAVLDYDLNHDEAVLSKLEAEAGRIEILVDEICYSNCPKRSAHYKYEGECQLLGFENKPFDCPNTSTKPSFSECMKRTHFISNEEIGSYIDRGFVNFKLVGRGLPESLLIDSILYYLVKEEERDFIKEKLLSTLAKVRGR